MQITASITAVILGFAATLAHGHMEMTNPPPLGSSKNKLTPQNQIDYNMKSPLNPDGSNYPCRGLLRLLDGQGGGAVATWAAGSQQRFTVDGGAFHGGGSCQVSLSYDKGATWTVIHSYEGSCPVTNGPSSYDFIVPADAASGNALFAWSWFNKIGNREMYMNCASIKIEGASGKTKKRRGVAMSSRPAMFVANVGAKGNGCGTSEGKDLQFPDAGPDVTLKGNNFGPPTGNCPAPSSNNNQGNSGSGGSNQPANSPANPPASQPAKPPANQPANPPANQPANPPANPPASASPSLPGGVFATVTAAGLPSGNPTSSASVSTSPTAPPPSAVTAAPVNPSPVGPTDPATQPTNNNNPTGGSGSGGSSNSFPAWSKCQNLGDWNCIGGKQFQRCASGNMWSVAQPLAAGTSCQPGVQQHIVIF